MLNEQAPYSNRSAVALGLLAVKVTAPPAVVAESWTECPGSADVTGQLFQCVDSPHEASHARYVSTTIKAHDEPLRTLLMIGP